MCWSNLSASLGSVLAQKQQHSRAMDVGLLDGRPQESGDASALVTWCGRFTGFAVFILATCVVVLEPNQYGILVRKIAKNHISWLGGGVSASLPHFRKFPQKHSNMLEEPAGIRKNLLTGYISDQAERGGIHFLGPLKTFFVVPAAQGTLQWSWRGGDRAPVQTRTGADPQDPDSGGQPISISCAVQAACWKAVVKQIRQYFKFPSGRACVNHTVES